MRATIGLALLLALSACAAGSAGPEPRPAAPDGSITTSMTTAKCTGLLQGHSKPEDRRIAALMLDVPEAQAEAAFCRGLGIALGDGRLQGSDLRPQRDKDGKPEGGHGLDLMREIRTSLAGPPRHDMLERVPQVVGRDAIDRCIDESTGPQFPLTDRLLGLVFNVPRHDSVELTCRLFYVGLERDVVVGSDVVKLSRDRKNMLEVLEKLQGLLDQLAVETSA
jgi:hypothetical protein